MANEENLKKEVEKLRKQKKRLLGDIDYLDEHYNDVQKDVDIAKRELHSFTKKGFKQQLFIALGQVASLFTKSSSNEQLNKMGEIGDELLSKINDFEIVQLVSNTGDEYNVNKQDLEDFKIK